MKGPLKTVLPPALIIILLVISSVSVSGCLGNMESESSESLYLYELRFSTSGPLENATLLIPIPSSYNEESGNNETFINISEISFRNFDRGNLSVDIEDVKGVPMLRIAGDRITPVYKNYIQPIAIMPGQNESELPEPTQIYSDRYSEKTPLLVEMELHMQYNVDHEIETRMPVGKEPLFMPYRIQKNFSSAEGGMYEDCYLREGASGHIFEVPFILLYETDDENVLTISSDFQGINQWWVLGWQSNSYSERIRHEFMGKGNGTSYVRGVLMTGEGVY